MGKRILFADEKVRVIWKIQFVLKFMSVINVVQLSIDKHFFASVIDFLYWNYNKADNAVEWAMSFSWVGRSESKWKNLVHSWAMLAMVKTVLV